jgi:hypothetical protein
MSCNAGDTGSWNLVPHKLAMRDANKKTPFPEEYGGCSLPALEGFGGLGGTGPASRSRTYGGGPPQPKTLTEN